MTENKRFIIIQDEDNFTVRDTLKNRPMGMFEFKEDEFPVYFCFHKIIDLLNELHDENKQLRNDCSILVQSNQEYRKEDEQLKQVLGSILIEVKRDITNTSQTGEVKVFINPNSFDLISDVLRKYGALKEWYE